MSGTRHHRTTTHHAPSGPASSSTSGATSVRSSSYLGDHAVGDELDIQPVGDPAGRFHTGVHPRRSTAPRPDGDLPRGAHRHLRAARRRRRRRSPSSTPSAARCGPSTCVPDRRAAGPIRSARAGPRRTRVAHPSCSKMRMSRALESSCPRSTPWRADAGMAWCRLCHDSPNESTARARTLPLWSFVRNGRRPNTWQIELMLHVTWWSSAMRTTPAHRNAVRAPCRVPASAQPRSSGQHERADGEGGEPAAQHDDVAVAQEVGRVARCG